MNCGEPLKRPNASGFLSIKMRQSCFDLQSAVQVHSQTSPSDKEDAAIKASGAVEDEVPLVATENTHSPSTFTTFSLLLYSQNITFSV